VWLLFSPFTTAFLLLTGLELISFQHLYNSMVHPVSAASAMLHCGAGFTMQAGPSLDRGLPRTSGQGLPAQGM